MEIDCLDKRATSEHTHKEPAANNVPGVTRQVEMVSSVPSTDGDTRIEVPRGGARTFTCSLGKDFDPRRW